MGRLGLNLILHNKQFFKSVSAACLVSFIATGVWTGAIKPAPCCGKSIDLDLQNFLLWDTYSQLGLHPPPPPTPLNDLKMISAIGLLVKRRFFRGATIYIIVQWILMPLVQFMCGIGYIYKI